MDEPKLRVAVVGLGRAGQARVRALQDHPRACLGAIARREPGPGEHSFEEVLEDSSLAALILCTPNRQHAAAARVGLERGKHVLVEFPLAETEAEGREIFETARRVGRVAHVEHIELLSPSQQSQRDHARSLGHVLDGELVFRAGGSGWIADAELAGSPALRAVARLHRLVDLFGDAEVGAARLRQDRLGYRLEVSLGFPRAGGARVRLVEERGVGLSRRTQWAIRCEKGLLGDPPTQPVGALFRLDLDHFIDRVERGSESYVSEERVLRVLQLVERIDTLCGITRC
jgi:predicted dehydrogenase